MSKYHFRRGFTLIELMVVVVIVVILAMITATIYKNTQLQARDAQVASMADKVADALLLFMQKEGHLPAGGIGSTAAATGSNECTDGAGGWFAKGIYLCSVEDSLINKGYLPASFSSSLPSNPQYAANNKQSIMIYQHSSGPYAVMVYYSMESPTQKDTDRFNAEMTRCGLNPAGSIVQRDTYGMKNGICIKYHQ